MELLCAHFDCANFINLIHKAGRAPYLFGKVTLNMNED